MHSGMHAHARMQVYNDEEQKAVRNQEMAKAQASAEESAVHKASTEK